MTVAAIPGHAFAAGAMLALAHDHRMMRADRGFWCVQKVDLGMAFTPGMTALLRARLAPQVAHEAMLTGKRYGGEEAAALAIVDAAVAEDEVLPRAVELADPRRQARRLRRRHPHRDVRRRPQGAAAHRRPRSPGLTCSSPTPGSRSNHSATS